MRSEVAKHPHVFWCATTLCLIAFTAIGWSSILFYYVGDMLCRTGTDLVNMVVLLSGVLMLPVNFFIMYSLYYGREVGKKTSLWCCKLWMWTLWIIIINIVGISLCVRQIYFCHSNTIDYIQLSMHNYKMNPKHKRFIDNLQWTLKCCGLYKYDDWFTHDWDDNTRDYEWDPPAALAMKRKKNSKVTDSVPLRTDFHMFVFAQSVVSRFPPNYLPFLLSIMGLMSMGSNCCKSGSCVSSFLNELGTYSIYTDGCGRYLFHLLSMSMGLHLAMFITATILEILLLHYFIKSDKSLVDWGKKDINYIATINKNFYTPSESYQLEQEDSEDLE